MRENTLRTMLTRGRPALNGWLSIPSPVTAELMASFDWDSLTVDLQHGLIDYQAAVGMLQAISTRDVTPLARVPWLEPGIIMKMLDAGAYGVICPMINSRDDCARFVGACRYAPAGYRSFGPQRASLYAGADYHRHANETVLTLAMIETAQALENLEAILGVDGLDGVYVGPSDLALSLGHDPQSDTEREEVLEAVRLVLAAAQRHGRFAGIHSSTIGSARRMLDLGFDFVTAMSDARFLRSGADEVLRALGRGAATGAPTGQSMY